MANYTNKSFVYLFCDPSQDLFKIGVTKNLYSKRMKQLQTGNANELKVVTKYYCNYPYRLESILHNRFSHKKVLNEWYSLSLEEVVNFEKTCQEVDNIIEVMKDNIFFAKNLH